MSRVDEDDEDDDAFEGHDLNLTELIKFDNGKEKPKTKAMRGSNSLSVPRRYDRMERISEASENAFSRSSSQVSSHMSSDDDAKPQGGIKEVTRNKVRRNSSGTTSSSFISNLSEVYDPVYDKVRRPHTFSYKSHQESAA